ncbi:DUF423 domain-containing protein [Tahibacter soli]|uniref:DUF423 domain-containing protein n=1 Tax=Tahibacter soli TaxID=2983605 RepID=A0A9X4BH32_9GAMM|nr:DUF423 domain-containing protein [Tahibacter soli]MDC8011863.1 DUF423 domain-containing protein [Tahibacter soli]
MFESPHKTLGAIAAMLGAIAVALGAFGAHALRGTLDPAALAIWQTAVSYLFWHVLAALAALHAGDAAKAARIAAALLLAGAIVFSGSLFALALGAPRWFGAITPVGGTLLIAGWIALAAHYLRRA